MIEKTAVIGHGPSLIDLTYGKKIDSHRYIVRFPYIRNWQIPEKYGSRTSFYVASAGRIQKRLRPDLPENGYWFWNKHGNKMGVLENFLIRNHRGVDMTTTVVEWQKQIAEGYDMSHGCAGICLAMHILKLPVAAFGCDNLKTGDDDTESYIGSWKYEKRRMIKFIDHSPSKELEFITALSKERGIQVEFV